MKKILLIALLLTGLFVNAQEAEIKKAITTFFEGMHTRDTLKMQSAAVKEIVLQSINDKGSASKLFTESPDEFYKSIAKIPATMKIEERILDYKIQIDGPMAHVWTPYEFYINGKFSHKGVNSFQLFNDNGTWKIVYIIDTRRK